MWFKKILKKFLKINYFCSKCNSPTMGDLHCEKCKRYFELIEYKRLESSKIVEENKRKNFIIQRDKYLECKND